MESYVILFVCIVFKIFQKILEFFFNRKWRVNEISSISVCDIVQIGFHYLKMYIYNFDQFQFNWINDTTEFYKSVRFYAIQARIKLDQFSIYYSNLNPSDSLLENQKSSQHCFNIPNITNWIISFWTKIKKKSTRLYDVVRSFIKIK